MKFDKDNDRQDDLQLGQRLGYELLTELAKGMSEHISEKKGLSLIRRGADVDVVDNEGHDSLRFAVGYNNQLDGVGLEKVIVALASKVKNPYRIYEDGQTIEDFACRNDLVRDGFEKNPHIAVVRPRPESRPAKGAKRFVRAGKDLKLIDYYSSAAQRDADILMAKLTRLKSVNEKECLALVERKADVDRLGAHNQVSSVVLAVARHCMEPVGRGLDTLIPKLTERTKSETMLKQAFRVAERAKRPDAAFLIEKGLARNAHLRPEV